MFVSFLQYANGFAPILLTPAGIVTLVRPEQPKNASSPIEITSYNFFLLFIFSCKLFSFSYSFFDIGITEPAGYSNEEILKIAGIGFTFSVIACLIMQGVLFLVPNVDAMTRWVVLLYCALPASFLAPSLSRNEKESVVYSGVCSLLTVVTLISFCVIAAFS